MEIGNLNQRIAVLENHVKKDVIGNHKARWEEVFSLWASVKFGNTVGSAAEEAVEKVGDKYYVNNSLLIRMELERAGLRPECIDISTDCTSCQPERFWSYRRVGQNRGSLAAIIAL